MDKKVIRGTKSFKVKYEDDSMRLGLAQKSHAKFLKEQNVKGINGTFARMGNTLYQLMLSGYSYGIDLETLKRYGERLFECYLKSWEGDVYCDIAKSYEIAIIFDLKKEEVMKFAELQKKYNYKDKYLDLLVMYFDDTFEITTEKLKFNRAILPLVEVIELAKDDKEKSIARLKLYLDKQWLNMQKEGLITNRQHLKEETFRGYWCIEAVALVKMLGLNDEILIDHIHYPYELAHYNESVT